MTAEHSNTPLISHAQDYSIHYLWQLPIPHDAEQIKTASMQVGWQIAEDAQKPDVVVNDALIQERALSIWCYGYVKETANAYLMSWNEDIRNEAVDVAVQQVARLVKAGGFVKRAYVRARLIMNCRGINKSKKSYQKRLQGLQKTMDKARLEEERWLINFGALTGRPADLRLALQWLEQALSPMEWKIFCAVYLSPPEEGKSRQVFFQELGSSLGKQAASLRVEASRLKGKVTELIHQYYTQN